ncbi:MAG: T9SS type A sorting domain-containing protein, partial [Bacteroidota bacterium]|nr:T9SS type A sorting domain-containing protein [Bacteroidota bacterium]
ALSAGEYRIYTSVQLQKPDINTTLPEFEDIEKGNTNVYPNPSSSIFNIDVDIKQNSELSVEVCNSFGQKMESLFCGDVKAQELHFEWNAKSSAASGLYFVVVSVDNKKEITKIVVK